MKGRNRVDRLLDIVAEGMSIVTEMADSTFNTTFTGSTVATGHVGTLTKDTGMCYFFPYSATHGFRDAFFCPATKETLLAGPRIEGPPLAPWLFRRLETFLLTLFITRIHQ